MPSDAHIIERTPAASPASALPYVVGFYFAFRLFIMLLSVRVLDADPRTGTAISLATDFLLLLCVAFSSLGEVRHPLSKLMQVPAIPWVIAFLGFSCCSLLWSDTASMAASIAYWCGMTADIVIVVLLIQSAPLTEVTNPFMEGYVWGAVLVAAIAWIMPAQADLRLGDDELLGANNIGYLCGFAFFFAQYLMLERKRKFGIQAFFLALSLLRTLSKTTIVAFIVSQGILLVMDKSISRRSKVLSMIGTLVVVAALWNLLSSYYDIYSSTGNQSSTLSGRLGIWAYFLLEGLQQPWIGHGFDSVWKVVPPFGPDRFEAPHAHNELLQQFYTYGVVGICLFLMIYWSIYKQVRRLASGAVRTFSLALLIFVLVRGTADTDRFDLSLPMWAILMFSLLMDQAYSRQAALRETATLESLPGTLSTSTSLSHP